MKKKKIMLILFLFIFLLLSSCSKQDDRYMKDTPPIILARANYGDIYFESAPYNDGYERFSTRYGFSKGERSDIAYFSIKNNDSTFFRTYILNGDDNPDGNNFDYYYFSTNTGYWNINIVYNNEQKLYVPSESIIKISSGAGDGSFVLRGGFDDEEYSDLIYGNIKGWYEKEISYSIIKIDYIEKKDTAGKVIDTVREVSDKFSDISWWLVQKTFHQAIINVNSDKNVKSNNHCVLLIEDDKSIVKFKYEKGDTVRISSITYGNNIKNAKEKLILMGIGLRFGLKDYDIENNKSLNLMNFDSDYYHLNKDQWEILRNNIR